VHDEEPHLPRLASFSVLLCVRRRSRRRRTRSRGRRRGGFERRRPCEADGRHRCAAAPVLDGARRTAKPSTRLAVEHSWWRDVLGAVGMRVGRAAGGHRPPTRGGLRPSRKPVAAERGFARRDRERKFDGSVCQAPSWRTCWTAAALASPDHATFETNVTAGTTVATPGRDFQRGERLPTSRPAPGEA
jgi:hypothetical protein